MRFGRKDPEEPRTERIREVSGYSAKIAYFANTLRARVIFREIGA